VAKFHRNQCYQPDLSGEYGSEDENNVRINDWKQCRSKDEDIVVSKEADVPAGVNADAQPVAFEFPIPIPINATDLYLQVVYRGPLGQENDAVAVATKDIAEPDFQIGTYNTAEQYSWAIGVIGIGVGIPLGDGTLEDGLPEEGTASATAALPSTGTDSTATAPADGTESTLVTFRQRYCAWAETDLQYEECKYQYRISTYMRFAPPANFDPANPIETIASTAAIENIAVSRYGRLALLTDPGPFSVYWIGLLQGDTSAELYTDTFIATTNQLDPETNNLTSTRYRQKRGIHGADVVYKTLSAGEIPDPPPINPPDPVPARVNF
jgi:hypothetical protein